MRADVRPHRHGFGADAARPAGDRRREGVAIGPDEILAALVELDPGLGLESYYSERSVFYNPGKTAPLGVIFASLKDRDGPNDKASQLSRPGVYRLAFQLSPDEYEGRFGPAPPRPGRGGVVALYADLTALNTLTPHPVYAWMRWVQILSPTAEEFAALRPLLDESLAGVRAKWERREISR
jgi:hypothetical protein